jgi:uncharacterized protein involved in type VI secretion and phage assembly
LKHVQAHAWDFKNQILASAKASEVAGTGQGNLSGPKLAEVASPDAVHLGSTVPFAAGELKSWADAKLLKSRLAKIGGRVKVFGNDALRPNQVIALAGLGARFNGPAFVSAVEHVIRDGNWWTVLGTGSSPHWFSEEVDVSAPVAAAQLPGIRGLQNGIVKSIAEDPEGETRIQVTVPMLTVTSEPGDLWARWVQPYATSKAGSFFLPEVGDEVLLGFLNEDPRYPVVLGSLYGTKHAPPYTPDSTNPKKAIVTRSELKVEFDDENKVLTIQTPGKNKLVLSDQDQGITLEDQNGNKITLAAGGITLKSAASITIQATNSVDVKGLGVSVASDAQASIKAQASLEVSSAEVSVSGQASLALKGGMITLN